MTTSGAANTEAAAASRPETMSGHDRPTTYYDGACPLCAREIGFYRRQNGADRICWVDISDIDTVDVAPDLSREQALALSLRKKQSGRGIVLPLRSATNDIRH